ncbi:MAG: DUF6259 domain-containing protein [Armatimonadota bacterium]|nr:DUF6259 domain-containing protein [Armatimonadota bacterium]
MQKNTPTKDIITIRNEYMSIALGIDDGKVNFKSIADSSGNEFLSNFKDQSSIWRIIFRGLNGEVKEVESNIAVLSDHQNAKFTWTVPLGDAKAEVRTSVRLDSGSHLSYWSLSAKLPAGWKVSRADFPIIPNIKRAKGLRMAAPFGWGLEYELKPGETYDATYPSLVAAMQFVAFYASGHGLYIGTHDPQANHKRFIMKAMEDRIGFTITNLPAISDKGSGSWRLPYETAVGVFAGDYYDAAQIYREWTFNAPWGKAGPISKRPIPQWLKDTDLWIRVKDVWNEKESEPIENLEMAKEAAGFFGLPIALHWYTWHQIPFDTLYPEYFPAKPNFAEGVKALQAAGFHVMPYINGRLCDPKSKTWLEEHADLAAARQENGEPYTEVYGSKVPLNVMCPFTKQWQEKITGIVDRLVNEYEVDGVYIDQISAASAVQCFSSQHGHPIGGGKFWADGYRKLLDMARARLPKGRILTTEENAECWLDQFDALLLVNTPVGTRKVIPLFPAVYSGRTITFGFQYTLPEDLKDSAPWRAKMAQAFAFGSQLGWVSLSVLMAPDVRQEAEFLRTLARCRRFAHEFVVTGRFLGMLDVRGDNPAILIKGKPSFGNGTYTMKLPSVLASAWLAENQTLGITLVNQSNEDHEVEVRLPLDKAGIKASKGFLVERFGSEGKEFDWESTSAIQKVIVSARGALLLKVKNNHIKTN